MLRGRTVLLLLAICIMLSSFATLLFIQSDMFNVERWLGLEISDRDDLNQHDPDDGHVSKQTGFGQHAPKLKEAYDIIMNHYVSAVDEDELIRGALDGMLNVLEDPFTVYMDAEEAQRFEESLQSSFEGIGAEVMLEGDRVTIVSPIKGSPAEGAGLRSRDQIISVNGVNIEGYDLHEAVMLIRGPKGSEAVLEIMRPGLTDLLQITLIRDEIPLESVYTEIIEKDGHAIGVIKISSFARDTVKRFSEELERLENEGIDGLLIDVRNNPGGYLHAVESMGKLIVPNNSIITEIENKNGEKVVYRSNLEEPKPYPINILINGGSASASEILAAALQEGGGYQVIGETSFGKGSVQSTVSMQDSSEIKITIAKWLTPNGNWIDGKGVQPDIEVSQPDYFSALRVSTDPVLEQDMNNEHVRNLQIVLDAVGYDPGRKDGFFSAETTEAVQRFQQDFGLDASGVVDEDTATQLEEQITKLIRDPANDRQLQRAAEALVDQLN